MVSKPQLRVLIVDESRIFRQGLRFLWESLVDLEVVGDADHETALAVAFESRPTVILLSLSLQRSAENLGLLTQLRERHPTSAVVALVAPSDGPDLVYRAVQAGADGCLSKSTGDVDELEVAIRTVAAGQPYVSPAILPSLINVIKAGNETNLTGNPSESAVLSAREQDVLDLVARGFTNRQIAEQLTISDSTVRSHLHNILDKLQLTNRVQAAAFALRNRPMENNYGNGSSLREAHSPYPLYTAASKRA